LRSRRAWSGATSTPTTTTTDGDATPSTPADAIELYSQFVAAELADKRSAKDSFERRGFQLVTTSGALLTVVFGLISLIARDDSLVIPSDARPWLYASLAAFVIAAVGGLVANAPMRYRAPTPAALRAAISGSHKHSAFSAHVRIAKSQTTALESYWLTNRWKSRSVTAAIAAQVVAVAALAVVIAYVVANRKGEHPRRLSQTAAVRGRVYPARPEI